MADILDGKQIEVIEKALKRGERVELISTRDCVKIIRIRREELRPEKSK